MQDNSNLCWNCGAYVPQAPVPSAQQQGVYPQPPAQQYHPQQQFYTPPPQHFYAPPPQSPIDLSPFLADMPEPPAQPQAPRKKRFPVKMLAILLSVLLVTGGGVAVFVFINEQRIRNERQAYYESLDESIEEPYASEEPTTPTPSVEIPALTAYSGVYKTDKGYEIKATYNVGKWIKATDTALLEAAWKDIGGIGAFPIVDGRNHESESGQFDFHMSDAYFFFGRIQYSNVTSGFSIDNTSRFILRPRFTIVRKGDGKAEYVLVKSAVVNSRTLVHRLSSSLFGGTEAPWMTSNSYTIPFLIGVYAKPTPDWPLKTDEIIETLSFTCFPGGDWTPLDEKIEFKVSK